MATLTLDVILRRTGFTLEARQRVSWTGIAALFGPSGSGKTTLLRLVAGLEREARGTVALDGETWQDARRFEPPHRRRVGYVFQDGRLFAHLDVEHNLRFALARASTASSGRARIGFDEIVTALDLGALLARRTSSLSGGEQQRVAIARALLSQPRLLLMDEPLSSLDSARKREILPYIERLPATFGVPVLYVTHSLDEVARLASSVVLVGAGRIVATGGVAEIFERPDLAPFTGGAEAGAVLRVRVTEHSNGIATLTLGSERLRVPMPALAVGTDLPLRIHARDVAIATRRPSHLSIRNVLAGRILRIERETALNADVVIDVAGQHLRSRITLDALDELGLAPDQEVFALIKSVALESDLLG